MSNTLTTQSRRLRAPIAAAVALSMLSVAQVHAASTRNHERDISGVRVQIDNDLFAGDVRDRDYTGGMAITISGRDARESWASLDPVLEHIGKVIPAAHQQQSTVRHARQLGLIAFTPGDTLTAQPLHNDRPYASLLFTSNGRVAVDADNRNAWSSSITVGVLGLSLSGRLHSRVHEVVGSESPHGYRHQISAGGEPTARYTLARHHLWVANPSGTIDIKTTVQGSVGFLTETSAAISLRAGRLDSQWWSFAPELTDYTAAPIPVEGHRERRELYFFTGARLKARAYNALLQGQFRDNVIEYSASDVRPFLAEAWIGVVTQLLEQTQLSYTLNYQTAEVRRGKAARDSLWGAVQFSHSF